MAEIPHDLVGSSGQILAAEVHAVAGPKKRKRSELAVAIDHQGVNVYDVIIIAPLTLCNWTDGCSRFNPPK